jgi:hypothetical protein
VYRVFRQYSLGYYYIVVSLSIYLFLHIHIYIYNALFKVYIQVLSW